MRENVVLRAAAAVSSSGYLATYVHNALAPGCGTMCSAVALEHDTIDLSQDVPEKIAEFGKHLSMQVRAVLRPCKTAAVLHGHLLCYTDLKEEADKAREAGSSAGHRQGRHTRKQQPPACDAEQCRTTHAYPYVPLTTLALLMQR